MYSGPSIIQPLINQTSGYSNCSNDGVTRSAKPNLFTYLEFFFNPHYLHQRMDRIPNSFGVSIRQLPFAVLLNVGIKIFTMK